MKKLYIGFWAGDCLNGTLQQLFQEALPNHPDVEKVDFDCVFKRCGKEVLTAVGGGYIRDHLLDYDLLFINHSYVIMPENDALFTQLNIWKKIVILDIYDNQQIDVPELINKCFLYVKHSWKEGYLPQDRSNMIPLDFGIVKPYYEVIPVNNYSLRDLNITCTLATSNRHACNRDIICHTVRTADWYAIEPQNWKPYYTNCIQITIMYGTGWQQNEMNLDYRNNMSPEAPRINWWYVYQHILKRTQILFTGTAASATGDNRTWEAFSSGALVFIDDIPIPNKHQMIEGEHYIRFDFKDPMKNIKLAKQLLIDDTERTKIAMNAYNYAMKYHTSEARINDVMDAVRGKLNERMG